MVTHHVAGMQLGSAQHDARRAGQVARRHRSCSSATELSGRGWWNVRTERRRLATALADGLLAGDWVAASMRDAARRVLGERHRWARDLVAEVLSSYPRAPLDRPREFLAFVMQTQAMDEVERRASRRRRAFPSPVHWITEPTTMVRRPFPVAPVDHAGQLAELFGLTMPELLWFADTRGFARRAGSDRLHHYRSRWLATRSGGARLLEAPLPRLRAIQRLILDQMLSPVPVHEAAHGFVAGRSVRTGARPHVGAAFVITLDLESFFASINAGRVYGVFRTVGYPEPVAHLLTGLCTRTTSVRVLAAMPPTNDGGSAFRLRKRLAAAHLPQGAPTSPQLANLCAHHLDRRLRDYGDAIGAVYTRYADDLTFSGPDLEVRGHGVIAAVGRIVREEGFVLNEGKTRIRGRDTRQQVTGVVVNTGTRVPREQFDLLRAILHNCRVHGPHGQNRWGHSNFRAHLRGRIDWVASLDGEQGRRLLVDFDEIDWGDPS